MMTTILDCRLKKLFYMYGCIACIYVYAHELSCALKIQKRTSDLLELEIEMALSSLLGARN